MRIRRLAITAGAALTSFAMLAASCSSAIDTGEVSAASGAYGASLATSTTIPDIDAPGLLGSQVSGGRRAEATENLLNSLAENPGLLNDLENLTPDQLEELTGLESDELGTLGITPATVGALGGVLNQIGGDSEEEANPQVAALLAAGGGDLAAGGGDLLTSGGELTTEAVALLAGLNIDPVTMATLIATSLSVPDSVTTPLGEILAIIDPSGLGQFSEDNAALSVITVLMGAVIGKDPETLRQLANAQDINPRYRYVISFITGLATTLSPAFVDRLNNITGILGPWGIRGIGAAISLLERPAVGAIFEEAFQDPTTVATAFGSALVFIPGLAETVAPNTFADPDSIYSAVLGLSAAALLNMDAPGFRDFVQSFGVELPPELLD